MENNKNVFVAIVLCAGIFFLWERMYTRNQPPTEQSLVTQAGAPASAPAGTTAATAQAQGSGAALKKEVAAPAAPQTLVLGEAGYKVSVSTRGGTITGVELGDYRGRGTESVAPLIAGGQQLRLTTPSKEWAYLSSVTYSVQARDKDAQGNERLVLAYDDKGVTIQRTYTVSPKIYAIDHEVAVKFKDLTPGYLFVDLEAHREVSKELSENEKRELFFNKAGGQKTKAISDVTEVGEDLGQLNWVGFASRYFLNAVVDRNTATHPQYQERPLENGDVAASLIYKVSGPTMNIPLRYYYGPKDIDVLKQVGNHLDAAVDFGWFTIFAYPLLEALKWFNRYVHNFGLAIILVTILVKVLTYPLTLKSMKSMKEMQRIQPQLARLRERHKDDKEKLNREMLQLMKSNGYNPASGCLPILIQMPIFIALYNVLFGAIDLYGQPFFGWILDLSAKDPYYVTPVLLAAMMFLQQKMTPNTATDPAQQRMMMFMPVIFGFMMLWLPSGLTLYMLVNSVVSILQQVLVNRHLDAKAPAVVVA